MELPLNLSYIDEPVGDGDHGDESTGTDAVPKMAHSWTGTTSRRSETTARISTLNGKASQ